LSVVSRSSRAGAIARLRRDRPATPSALWLVRARARDPRPTQPDSRRQPDLRVVLRRPERVEASARVTACPATQGRHVATMSSVSVARPRCSRSSPEEIQMTCSEGRSAIHAAPADGVPRWRLCSARMIAASEHDVRLVQLTIRDDRTMRRQGFGTCDQRGASAS
jgi:hypothetical protein